MQKTFSYRRRKIVQDAPVIAELVKRWPALFTVSEVRIDVLYAVLAVCGTELPALV